jgi:uncharacterized damage-inducible protein DinB
MKEKERLIKLFNDHYDGSPWLDVSIADQLDGISHTMAKKKIGNCNSIWQLVYHMMQWRLQNMKRISGKIAHAPDHNFIVDIQDTSSQAWEQLKVDFKKTHHTFVEFLSQYDEADFDQIYSPNDHSYYEHIQGILIHDAYHLGQIVLLRKLLNK